MSEQEYQILAFMKECRHCTRIDLLNAFTGKIDIDEVNLLLQSLSKRGLIYIDFSMNADITPNGLAALLQVDEAKRKGEAQRAEEEARKRAAEAKRLQERLEDQADAERRYRGQNRVTIIASLLSFFLGMAVEHFSGVLEFLIRLFH